VVENTSWINKNMDIDDRTVEFILMSEGRQGPHLWEIVGKRGISKGDKAKLEDALRAGSAKAVAAGAVAVIAATNPVIANLYFAYQAAKYAYPIAKAGIEAKVESGDNTKALEAMEKKTIEQTGKVIVDTTVEAISDAAVDGAFQATGVAVSASVKKFVSAAISEAIEEVIQ
jgi:hypothetical protein